MRISDWSSDVCSSDLIPGGLGYVAVFASVLLASMSGSAIADTAALSTILLPMMRQHNYPEGYSAGLLSRSEEHTSELQSLMRISYAVFCLKKKKITLHDQSNTTQIHTTTNHVIIT